MAKNQPLHRNNFLFITGLMIVLLFSMAMRLYQIDGFSGDYDDGVRVMVAWLMSRGFSLYTEIASNQLPFLYQPIAWLFAWTGPSQVMGRWVEICYTMIGLTTVAAIGKYFRQPLMGLLAALFLSLEPFYFFYSRMSVGSVAAASMGSVAVLFGLHYRRQKKRRWLWAAGFIFAFSLFIKPLSLFVGFLLLGLIIERWWQETPQKLDWFSRLKQINWQNIGLDCFSIALMGAIWLAICFLFYDGSEMLDRLIFCRLVEKTDKPRTLEVMLSTFSNHFYLNLAVYLLAGLSLPMIIFRRGSVGLFLLIWVGGSFGLLMAESAHNHHLVVLDIPLVLMAAYSVQVLFSKNNFLRYGYGSLVGVGIGFWLIGRIWSDPGYYDLGPAGKEAHPERWAAVQFLTEQTTPDQFVVTDDFSVPFVARRMALPPLADASRGSMECGLMSDELFIRQTDQHQDQVGAVIFWLDRFVDKLPVFPRWVKTVYAEQEQFDENRFIYYNRRDPEISHPLTVRFGGIITLEGYTLDETHPSQITFFWRKLKPSDEDFKITFRQLDEAGDLIAQYDQEPFQGFYPTSGWPVGVLLQETMDFSRIEPGSSGWTMGLYNVDTQEMLSVESEEKAKILKSKNLYLIDNLY